MAKTYSLKSIENLIDKYVNEYGGEVETIEEGVLGYGTTLLYNAENKKAVVIQEVYVSPWSSTHTIRQYNDVPKKYKKIVDTL